MAKNERPNYLWRCLIWLDQGANVLLGPPLNALLRVDGFGYNDETLSSVFGKYKAKCRACRWMCLLLHKLDPHHCRDAIERDEGVTGG